MISNLCFKARYRDNFGEEELLFNSDGTSLQVTIRGIEFLTNNFTELEPKEYIKDLDQYFEYDFPLNSIVYSQLEVMIPILIEVDLIDVRTELIVKAKSFLYKEFQINLNGEKYIDNSDNFEEGLISLQNLLPTNCTLKVCLSCKYSHYSPFGNDTFGTLGCFKKTKKKSTRIHSKAALLKLWDDTDEILWVQETFYCKNYSQQTIDDWCYSSWEPRTLEKKINK